MPIKSNEGREGIVEKILQRLAYSQRRSLTNIFVKVEADLYFILEAYQQYERVIRTNVTHGNFFCEIRPAARKEGHQRVILTIPLELKHVDMENMVIHVLCITIRKAKGRVGTMRASASELMVWRSTIKPPGYGIEDE